MTVSIEDRLSGLRQSAPDGEALSGFSQENTVRFVLDFPEHAEELIPFLEPDLFGLMHCQYLMAWVHKLHRKYQAIPTRAVVRDHVLRHLTVDDPYKEVLAVLDGKLCPREAPVIRDQLKNWTQKRLIGRIYSDEAMAAFHVGDYEPIKQLLDRAQSLAALTAPTFGGLSYEDLCVRTTTQDWLVDGVVMAGQPLFVAGPKKALKTGLALDLSVSIATGTKFIGTFPAPKARKVFFFSGESGEDDVQRRLGAIAKSRGLELPGGLDGLTVSFERPKLADPEYLAALARYLRNHGYEAMVVDPIYLSLMSGGKEVNAGDLYQMGGRFGAIADACKNAGVTPVLCHHFKKSAGESLDLDDMTMTGAAEYARQSILIRRAVPFTTPQNNVLQVRFHGAGRGDIYRVNVNEGQEMGSWGVMVEPEGEVQAAERATKRSLKEARLVDELLVALTGLADDGRPATKTAVREEMGVSGATVKAALNLAIGSGDVEEYQDGGKSCYRRLR